MKGKNEGTRHGSGARRRGIASRFEQRRVVSCSLRSLRARRVESQNCCVSCTACGRTLINQTTLKEGSELLWLICVVKILSGEEYFPVGVVPGLPRPLLFCRDHLNSDIERERQRLMCRRPVPITNTALYRPT